MAILTQEEAGSTYDLMEEPHVRVEHEEHSDLQALAEKCDPKAIDFTHIWHCRDRDPPLLGSPLKA